MSELKAPGKSFAISKREVWEAWEKVKANKGAPGVDGCSIGDFEADLKNNLYKIWNRMSSGSYFPPPVVAVEIPKPLQPGEWRSLGLFAVGDAGQLQQTLTSMPLKIWRTDQVTPLAPHPNDPGPSTRPGQSGAEFLATFVVTIPDGTPRQAVEDAGAGEAARARQLADQGHLERLWALPGQGRALSLYRARDSAEMEAIVKALPLDPWMTTELTPFTPHPSDPVTMST